MNLILSVLPGRYAICRLGPEDQVPEWTPLSAGSPNSSSATASTGILSITRTGDELSIVCLEAGVPEAVPCERGWRCLKVQGPIDLSLTGVLAALASPLAEAGISIFAVSTFDTDYLLVKDELLARAEGILVRAGHRIERG